MRLIGVLNDEKRGLLFSSFLNQKGIAHQLEIQPDTDWGSPNYGISKCRVWIYDEDQVEDALKWYHLFLENPQDALFYSNLPTPHSVPSLTAEPIPPPRQNIPSRPASDSLSTSNPPSTKATLWERQPMGWITRSLLITCCLLFFTSQLIKPPLNLPSHSSSLTLFTSPIEKALIYDYPYFYALIDRFIQLYGYEGLENPRDLPKEGRLLLQKINQTPFWQGFYNLALKEDLSTLWHHPFAAPLFEKIRQGDIWRLFSPALLHGDLFHLLFNMLWLIVLGKQIEQRLYPMRYILLICVIGILSNTAQYFMSGPNFIGFSGILCGMLTFIWMRQKSAPWEGYQLDRLTLLFMLIFIVGMAAVQALSFLLQKSLQWDVSPNIANMAHLTGAVVGLLLGKLNFFSWRNS